jgi:rhodanese-related sulfurtransferase
MTSYVPAPELSVKELKQQLDAGKPPVILDVREDHEVKIASLPKTATTTHIPLGQLPTRMVELEAYRGREIVVYCRSGGRSAMAAQMLIQQGYKAKNLTGGVLAWAREIDPGMQQY